jgi:nicotinamidase-related amidase
MPETHINQKSSVALILVDVINHFEFPDGDRLLRRAVPMAPILARLKKRLVRAGIPCIYVNDNFGQWRSDASALVDYCLRSDCAGKRFVEALRPEPDDYFVLKPMHSAFFQTPLELLLRHLGTKTLILCGLATNSCIVCTAHDANMREFRSFVVSDCCAARTAREHKQALDHIAAMAVAEVLPSQRLTVQSLQA